jgi:hypothetical protein
METTERTNATERKAPAPGELTLAEILESLRRPVPPKYLSEKSTGKFKATYMHHAVVRDFLDARAPGWEWTVRLEGIAGKVYVIGTLTVVGSDGRVSRDGLGNEDDDLDGYGDPSSNAEAQALRRAAMAFGFCRNLWRKP